MWRFGVKKLRHISLQCRERLWVVVDLKRRYRNSPNEWMNINIMLSISLYRRNYCHNIIAVLVIVIVISKLLKRHSKAKRRAPAYLRALHQIRGVFWFHKVCVPIKLLSCNIWPGVICIMEQRVYKICSKPLLEGTLCALEVFLCALVPRPVCARTRAKLRV